MLLITSNSPVYDHANVRYNSLFSPCSICLLIASFLSGFCCLRSSCSPCFSYSPCTSRSLCSFCAVLHVISGVHLFFFLLNLFSWIFMPPLFSLFCLCFSIFLLSVLSVFYVFLLFTIFFPYFTLSMFCMFFMLSYVFHLMS